MYTFPFYYKIVINKKFRVIVIENGEIAGYGSHDELLETNETYRQLFGTQYKNYMLQVSQRA